MLSPATSECCPLNLVPTTSVIASGRGRSIPARLAVGSGASDESRSQKVGSSDASSNALQNTDKEQWKPTAALENARRNTLVMLMPTKARDQGLKEQDTNFIIITSLQIPRQLSSHATERWIPWPVNDSHGETCRHRRGIKGCGFFRI